MGRRAQLPSTAWYSNSVVKSRAKLVSSAFVAAAAIHAPIGLRSVLREWLHWRGRSLDVVLALFSVSLVILGVRAAFAVYGA